jgi:hypothetical protein
MEQLFASGDLEEAVSQLLMDRKKPTAFLAALEDLKTLGKKVDWIGSRLRFAHKSNRFPDWHDYSVPNRLLYVP